MPYLHVTDREGQPHFFPITGDQPTAAERQAIIGELDRIAYERRVAREGHSSRIGTGIAQLVEGGAGFLETAGESILGRESQTLSGLTEAAGDWAEDKFTMLSPEHQEEASKQLFVDDPEVILGTRLGDDVGMGDVWTQALISAPQLLASLPAGGVAGLGAKWLAPAMVKALGKKAGKLVGKDLDEEAAEAVGTTVAGAIGGSGAEGAVAAGMSANEIEALMRDMAATNPEAFWASPSGQQAMADSNGDQSAALDLAVRRAKGQVALATGASTAALSIPGTAFGLAPFMGAASRISGMPKRVAARAGLGALVEGATEAPQSAAEQYILNKAMIEAGQNIDPMDNVRSAAATGATLGGVLGVGVGGVGGIPRGRTPEPKPERDAPPPPPQITDQGNRTEPLLVTGPSDPPSLPPSDASAPLALPAPKDTAPDGDFEMASLNAALDDVGNWSAARVPGGVRLVDRDRPKGFAGGVIKATKDRTASELAISRAREIEGRRREKARQKAAKLAEQMEYDERRAETAGRKSRAQKNTKELAEEARRTITPWFPLTALTTPQAALAYRSFPGQELLTTNQATKLGVTDEQLAQARGINPPSSGQVKPAQESAPPGEQKGSIDVLAEKYPWISRDSLVGPAQASDLTQRVLGASEAINRPALTKTDINKLAKDFGRDAVEAMEESGILTREGTDKRPRWTVVQPRRLDAMEDFTPETEAPDTYEIRKVPFKRGGEGYAVVPIKGGEAGRPVAGYKGNKKGLAEARKDRAERLAEMGQEVTPDPFTPAYPSENTPPPPSGTQGTPEAPTPVPEEIIDQNDPITDQIESRLARLSRGIDRKIARRLPKGWGVRIVPATGTDKDGRAVADMKTLARVLGEDAEGGAGHGAIVVGKKLISLAADMEGAEGKSLRDVVDALNHETIHALRGLFKPSEWQALERMINRVKIGDETLFARARRMYPDDPRDQQVEEAIAEAFRIWSRDKKAIQGQAASLLARIADFLRALITTVKEQDAGDIFELVESGEVGQRGDSSGSGTSFSKAAKDTNTSLPAFKKWFGDSKVVDENGEPLVVYHGTAATTFDVFHPLSHFGAAAAANARIENKRDNTVRDMAGVVITPDPRAGEVRDGEGIIPVYLSIKNPLRIDDDQVAHDVYEIARLAHAANAISAEERKASVRSGSRTDLIQLLQSKGYDGLVYTNSVEGTGDDSYVAFSPTQIKSIHNQGTFDPADRRISFSKAPVTRADKWDRVNKLFPGATRFSVVDTNGRDAGLYSALQRAIQRHPMEKASPQQWLGIIGGAEKGKAKQPIAGVKPEEIEWTGVRGWLDSQLRGEPGGPPRNQQPVVTKQAILDFLKANDLRLVEGAQDRAEWGQFERYGTQEPDEEYVEQLARELYLDGELQELRSVALAREVTHLEAEHPDWDDGRRRAVAMERVDEIEEVLADEAMDRARSMAYEVAYEDAPEIWLDDHGNQLRGRDDAGWAVFDVDGNMVAEDIMFDQANQYLAEAALGGSNLVDIEEGYHPHDTWVMPGLDNKPDSPSRDYRTLLMTLPKEHNKFGTGTFREAGHFNVDNIIAHVRFTTRHTPSGKKFVFIEEIQSDWLDALRNETGDLPDAPLKTSWVDLGIKRMMLYAARNGFDGIAWTTSLQQLARYNNRLLSPGAYRVELAGSHIDSLPGFYDLPADVQSAIKMDTNEAPVNEQEWATALAAIEWRKNSISQKLMDWTIRDGGERRESLERKYDTYEAAESWLRQAGQGEPTDVSGVRFMGRWSPRDQFIAKLSPEHVARRALATLDGEDGPRTVTIESTGESPLFWGGEGHRIQYDKMMPRAVNKAMKAHQSKQLELWPWMRNGVIGTVKLSGDGDYFSAPGFEITDAMREDMTRNGLPMFSVADDLHPAYKKNHGKIVAARQGTWKRVKRRLFGALEGETVGTAIRRNIITKTDPYFSLDRLLSGLRGQGENVPLDATSVGKMMEMSEQMSGRIAAIWEGFTNKAGETKGVRIYWDADAGLARFKEGGKPLKEVLAPIGTKYMAAFQQYGVARRVLDRHAKDGTWLFKGLSRKDAEAMVNNPPIPEFDTVFNDLQDHFDNMVDFAHETGLVDREMADKLKGYLYFPFYRKFDDALKNAPNRILPDDLPETLDNPNALDELIEGGERPLDDLYTTLVKNTHSIISASMRNTAFQRLGKTLDEVNRLSGDLEIGKRVSKKKRFDPHILTYKVNGEEVYYQIDDPAMWIALSALSPRQLRAWEEAAATISGVLRSGITLAPGFMISNLFRGKIHAAVTADAPLSFAKTLRGGLESFNNSASAMAIRVATGMGGYNYGQAEGAFEKEAKRQGRMTEGDQGVLQEAKDRFMAVFKGMERVGQATEEAERLAIYHKAIADGLGDFEATYRAMNMVNFGRKGAASGDIRGLGMVPDAIAFLIPMVPFLNARIQGLYRIWETSSVKGDQNKRIASLPAKVMLRGMIVTAATLAAYALSSQDDRWEDLTLQDKLGYDILLFPGMGAIRFPRAFEVGAMFGAVPILAWDGVRDTLKGQHGAAGEDIFNGLMSLTMQTLAFDPRPVALKPIWEVMSNHNSFFQAPIEPTYMKNWLPTDRYTSGTTEFSKGLSRMIQGQLSPVQIDHIVRGYTGTMGMLGMATMDTIMHWAGYTPDKAHGIFGDPYGAGMVEKVLGLGRFYKPDRLMASAAIGEFYELKQELDQLSASINEARSSGQYEYAQKLAERQGRPLAFRSLLNRRYRRMMELNRAIRHVTKDPNMSSGAKTKRIAKLREERRKLASQVIGSAERQGI